MKEYNIKRVKSVPTESDWANAEVAYIDNAQWEGFSPCPFKMEARLLADETAIYVNLITDERPLVANKTEKNSAVCEDSCMEFFLKPGVSLDQYLNFEINPTGVLYVSRRYDRERRHFLEVDHSIFEIKSIITRDKWQLLYKIPFDLLIEEFGYIEDNMLGNFYKCALEPTRHYATWNYVDTPIPDFHRPEFFGAINLQKL